MDLPWAAVEPFERGVLDETFLARVDRFVAAAKARGIRPIMNLHSTPCWAAAAPETVKQGRRRYVNWYTPAEAQDLARVSRHLATRYGEDLAAIELWNEPNLENFLEPDDLTKSERADRYAEMLNAVYPSVKEAAPSLPVIDGAIGGPDSDFLEISTTGASRATPTPSRSIPTTGPEPRTGTARTAGTRSTTSREGFRGCAR